MKIDAGGVSASSVQPEWSSKQSGGVAAAATANAGGDRTTLSTGGPTVASLVTQAMSAPDVRQERVQALRDAISSGTYQVDPQKLAAAMMSDS